MQSVVSWEKVRSMRGPGSDRTAAEPGAFPEVANQEQLDAWERMERPAIAALPYLMLVICAVLTIALSSVLSDTLITLGIAAATGAWMLFGFTLRSAARGQQPWSTIFFTVLVVLMAVLVVRQPIFGFYSFTGYFFAFWVAAGRWRLAAVAVVAVIDATSQVGGVPTATAGSLSIYALFVFVNVMVAGGITWFSWVSSEQNDRRKQLVGELSEANQKLEATLAENAGLHEQLLAQAREAGVTDERQRMAREIHDTLAQSLAGIVTQLQAADQAGRDGERRRHLDAAVQLARDGLTEARRSVHALRPEPLQGGRIEEALTTVAQRWSDLHGIEARVTTTGPARPMPPEMELTLLRAGQEALANVAKHARATRVGLTLSYIGDQVTLDVRDDGVGFVPGATPGASSGDAANGTPLARSPASGARVNGGTAVLTGTAAPADPDDAHLKGGFGLTAMRERVEGLAGTLEIESEPGGGTTISASLPIAAGQARS
jgi:signal transduction histidine kinase